MKKELKINRNDYILLEVLYMLDYLSFDNIIEKELINFRKLVEYQTFGNYFKNNGVMAIDNNFIKVGTFRSSCNRFVAVVKYHFGKYEVKEL